LRFFTVFYGWIGNKKTPAGKRRKTLPGIEAEPFINSPKEKQKGGRMIPCSFSIDSYTY